MNRMTVEIEPMRMPNFLTAKALGQELKVDAGTLTDEEAQALWDRWKLVWRQHVSSRRAALMTPEQLQR